MTAPKGRLQWNRSPRMIRLRIGPTSGKSPQMSATDIAVGARGAGAGA